MYGTHSVPFSLSSFCVWLPVVVAYKKSSSLSTAQYSFKSRRVTMHLMNIPYKITLLRVWTTYKPSSCRLHFPEYEYTCKVSVKKRLDYEPIRVDRLQQHSAEGRWKAPWFVNFRPKNSLYLISLWTACYWYACFVPLQWNSAFYEQVPSFVLLVVRVSIIPA
jgi:hypothetical protein